AAQLGGLAGGLGEQVTCLLAHQPRQVDAAHRPGPAGEAARRDAEEPGQELFERVRPERALAEVTGGHTGHPLAVLPAGAIPRGAAGYTRPRRPSGPPNPFL